MAVGSALPHERASDSDPGQAQDRLQLQGHIAILLALQPRQSVRVTAAVPFMLPIVESPGVKGDPGRPPPPAGEPAARAAGATAAAALYMTP